MSPAAPGSFTPVLEWEWTGSETAPTYTQVMSTPVAANLNDDNGDGVIDTADIPDIIFNSWSLDTWYHVDGVLRAISGDGSHELWSIETPAYHTGGSFTPAVGDLDGDGLPEIVTINGSFTRLLAFEHDGTFKWESEDLTRYIDVDSFWYQSLYGYAETVTIANIDQQGLPELIVGHLVLNHDGSLRWVGAGNPSNTTTPKCACVANLDLQGTPEIVVGNTAYQADGSMYWQHPALSDGFCAVANLDVDDYPEVVLVTGGYVYAIEHDGSLKWQSVMVDSHRGRGGAPTIADVDHDGAVEIGVAGSRMYFMLETDGTVKWQQPIQDRSSAMTASSVFDFEGDGSAEVVYADEFYVRIFRGADGAVLFQQALGSGTSTETSDHC